MVIFHSYVSLPEGKHIEVGFPIKHNKLQNTIDWSILDGIAIDQHQAPELPSLATQRRPSQIHLNRQIFGTTPCFHNQQEMIPSQ
jgi:hypothetical protein